MTVQLVSVRLQTGSEMPQIIYAICVPSSDIKQDHAYRNEVETDRQTVKQTETESDKDRKGKTKAERETETDRKTKRQVNKRQILYLREERKKKKNHANNPPSTGQENNNSTKPFPI